MQIHSSRHSKKCLYDVFSSRCRLIKNAKLKDRKIMSDNIMLKRFMIEKYSSKNIDDKRLIFIKFNLIYWFEYWLFDVLQLTNIEIYLYFTIYEMNNFDVELDLYLSRFHIVKWISRNEILRESFNKTFVLKSFSHFMIRFLKIWT
jgi:glycosyltransferase involved in cell wall biosynthesis